MIYKTIIIEDEKRAQILLQNILENHFPTIEIMAVADDLPSGVKAIRKHKPDFVFLDIEMPNFSGLEILDFFDENEVNFSIIFTTAYNHYAIEGYRVNAVDYLLKPFSYEEFLRAANKVLQMSEEAANQFPSVTADDEFIFLKVEYQWVRISLKDILYIESLKDYVKVHLEDTQKSVMSLISLKALEEKLPASKFMRINRSFIVSLEKINAISKNSIFINKTEITVGEQYKETFKTIVEKWLK